MICDKHGNYEEQCVIVFGSKFNMPCPDCAAADLAEEVGRDELDAQKKKDSIFRSRIEYAALPKKYRKFDIEDCRRIYPDETETAMTWLANAKDNPASLVFIGPKGTGKTTLACVMLKEWSRRSMGKFTTMFSMSKQSHEDGTAQFITPPLLVIDEAGRQMGTDAEKNRIFEIINERYNEERPTIFITNMKKKEFEKIMGPTLYDRIQEGHTEIKMIRESLRK